MTVLSAKAALVLLLQLIPAAQVSNPFEAVAHSLAHQAQRAARIIGPSISPDGSIIGPSISPDGSIIGPSISPDGSIIGPSISP
ncbi:MAG: hypothetical protein AAGD01_19820, partial [Acidobacteriota bacterium]